MVFQKSVLLPARFKWIDRVLIKMLEDTSLCTHMLILGQTQSGKTYLIFQMLEFLFRVKTHKFFLLNCNEKEMLEESLGLMFPNTNEKDKRKIAKFNISKMAKYLDLKIKPQNIKLKVYTPLMPNHLPDKLPAIFEPFTIPIDDWNEDCMQILYGKFDIQKIFQEYVKKVKDGKAISLPMVKKIFHEMEVSGQSVSWQTGIGGIKTVVYDQNAAHLTLRNFQTRLNYFDNYGIVSSPKNSRCLKKILKKDIKDRDTVSILNLSGLEDNQMMQFFCLTYFLKALRDIASEMDVIPYKIAPIIDEARFIMPKESEGKKEYHTGLQDSINKGLTGDRKKSIEYWMSTQSPGHLKPTTYKNMKIKMITHLDEPGDIEWVKEQFRDVKNYEIKGLFGRMQNLRDNAADYRFILVGQADKNQKELDLQLSGRNPKNVEDVANCFPCPRANMYNAIEKVGGEAVSVFRPNIRGNYKLIKEQLKANGYKNPEIDIAGMKAELIEEWKGENALIKEKIDKKHAKENVEMKKKDEKEEEQLKLIAEKREELLAKGERDDNLSQLEVLTGISRERIRKRIAKTGKFMQKEAEKGQKGAI